MKSNPRICIIERGTEVLGMISFKVIIFSLGTIKDNRKSFPLFGLFKFDQFSV